MILTETTSILDAALPVEDLSAHLRLGTGFAEDGLQDGVLTAYLRAALSAVEAQTGVTVLSRDFLWNITGFRDSDRIVLPIRPVSAVTTFGIFDGSNAETIIDIADFSLRADRNSATLWGDVPTIPDGGYAEIELTAGFADWSAVPKDLAHAIILLAAWFYENRTGSGGMPTAVRSLLAAYRPRRLAMGASS